MSIWFSSFSSFCAGTFGNVLLEIQIMRPPNKRLMDSPVCWRRGLIPSLDVPGAGTQQTQRTSWWARELMFSGSSTELSKSCMKGYY